MYRYNAIATTKLIKSINLDSLSYGTITKTVRFGVRTIAPKEIASLSRLEFALGLGLGLGVNCPRTVRFIYSSIITYIQIF